MRRREFIAGMGAAAAWSFNASTEELQKLHRLAFVHSGIPADQLTADAGPFWVHRFYETLGGLGDAEGHNLVVERYSAEGRSERYGALAAEVVGRKPDVIVCNLNDLVKAFMAVTDTIPLVVVIGDPIAGGLLTNLAHPGGNLTGVSISAGRGISAKRLEILTEAVPSIKKVVHLLSSSWGSDSSMREAGQRLGVTVTASFLPLVNDAELQRAFSGFSREKIDGAIIDESGSFLAKRETIVGLAEQFRVPVIYPYRDYVEAGGLIAFAPNIVEITDRMASDVHQILNGVKPGDIPFYQPSKFQMVLNLHTAQRIGLEIAASLIARADEVID